MGLIESFWQKFEFYGSCSPVLSMLDLASLVILLLNLPQRASLPILSAPWLGQPSPSAYPLTIFPSPCLLEARLNSSLRHRKVLVAG